HTVHAGRALATQAVPGRLTRAAPQTGAGVVAAAAVMVSGRLQILAGHPVVGLLDTLSPLGRRVPAWFRGGLAFVPLHGDAREVRHHLVLDVGDTVADATQSDEFRWRIRRFWRGQRPHRVKRLALAGQRGDVLVAEHPVEV